jgi:hypothetical protein
VKTKKFSSDVVLGAAAAAAVSMSALAGDAVQWRVADGGNGHWYQGIVPAPLVTWFEAKSRSESLGGHLVTFTSTDEHQFVYSRIAQFPEIWHQHQTCGCTSVGPWIGMRRTIDWQWVTGEPVSFTSWHPGEPWEGSPNDFVRFFHYTTPLSPAPLWDNYLSGEDLQDISTPTSFIVEWSADCNSDGIVDYGQCHDGSLADINGNNIPDCCEAGADCAAASSGVGQCVVFARGTDTVHIAGANTILQEDYTIEWSGYLLNQAVVTNPPATFNARIWSEQDSVTEDKAVGINPNQTPSGWVNSPCYMSIDGPTSLAVVTRTHVALVRLGSMVTMFVNGSAVSTAQQLCDPLNGGGSNMSLGAFVYVGQPSSNYWRAAPIALDWMRISGASRYTSSFVPPPEPLVTDSSTQLLINFNGPNTWRDLANSRATLTPGSGVTGGTAPALATDCNSNGIPDQAELEMPGADLDGNGILDVCEQPTCHDADLYPNGRIDGADLGILLSEWGPLTPTTHSDINHDAMVDGADLGLLLANWGPCNQ